MSLVKVDTIDTRLEDVVTLNAPLCAKGTIETEKIVTNNGIIFSDGTSQVSRSGSPGAGRVSFTTSYPGLSSGNQFLYISDVGSAATYVTPICGNAGIDHPNYFGPVPDSCIAIQIQYRRYMSHYGNYHLYHEFLIYQTGYERDNRKGKYDTGRWHYNITYQNYANHFTDTFVIPWDPDLDKGITVEQFAGLDDTPSGADFFVQGYWLQD